MDLVARGIRFFQLLLVVHLMAVAAKVPEEQQGKKEAGKVKDGVQCSVGCKPLFIGDQNCDPECNNEACQWDGGDCADKWQLRRMLVMGEFYESVDHVEYHAVTPDGKMKQLTMEQGRKWEGIDQGEAKAPDWRALVSDKNEEDFEGGTWEGKVWHSAGAYIGPRGQKPSTIF